MKFFNKIVANRLNAELHALNILSPNSFGFRRGKCTADYITELISIVEQNKVNGLQSLVIVTDLSKAFDMVKTNILVEKIKIYNIDNRIIGWTEKFLRNRSYFLRLGEVNYSITTDDGFYHSEAF